MSPSESRGTAPAERQLFDLSGRVAMVTGAGSGLGRAIAMGMARHGASIVAADIDGPSVSATATAIEAMGRHAIAVRCDVADEDSVRSLFEACDERFQRIDILVNNAFTPVVRARPEDFALDEWNNTLRVNLTGYFLCARAAGQRMIAQGSGSVVNISSIAGSSALGRGNFAYSVSKHGVNGLTRELAIEWAEHGIRVNAIQPCQFMTPAVTRMLAAAPDPKALMARFVQGIPLNRIGDPEQDIVGPAVFLASDAASMVTGVLLPVDGGNLALNAGGTKHW